VHAAKFAVVHVDERVDGLFQRRHRDVRHFPIVLEKLEEDNLAVLPKGCLDFAFRRALGNVGDVQRRRRLEDVGGVLGAGLLEPMERRTGVILGQLGSFETIILGALNVFVLGRTDVHRLAKERNLVEMLTRDGRHPWLSHLNERGVFLGEKNLDSEDVAVDAKECEEDVGRHSGFLQIGNDEDAAASLHATGHSHQSHALGGIAESAHAPAAELVVVAATLISCDAIKALLKHFLKFRPIPALNLVWIGSVSSVGSLSRVDRWFAQDAHSRSSGAARCDQGVIRKTCLPLTRGRITRLHHVVGTRWKSRVGEIPSSFVVVLDVEFGQFGVLNLQLATSVVDVLSVENLSRVLGGVTRTVLHQRLEDVILGEGDNLLDAPVFLEDVGDGVHADWMAHVFDVDVENATAG